MPRLEDLVTFCDERTNRSQITDFPPAMNGLQAANSGKVTKIGAAVDAGLVPFEMAATAGVDFLIVHHGMNWNPPMPLTGPNYRKVKQLLAADIAVYSSHLPLDLHREIGNNACIARRLGLEITDWFLPYEGNSIGAIIENVPLRPVLHQRIQELFPHTFTAIEAGPEQPRRMGLLSGSGQSAIAHLRAAGIDTFLTGELKQEHFNIAQEQSLNLYLGGHYATEVFGVMALAAEAAEKFGLEWEFLPTGCPL
ncbi:Nif3-like dinuclear metal center hexameric protein [Ruficoccus amylovorans]|uniref:Nif3-like dinuclear metal center hexameric protein n=1 Tax=Ruficoccus amylovorans TaxID=1804625 RepID=A0A842HIN7_9BACT|nr:Nif3-like dinuclear metal center hexameric protein [Ruficoccus amylovorans]MBC2596219.1 Nif3-like dinuclear metal center hexameric protein [Ruficoccus amylovorans]